MKKVGIAVIIALSLLAVGCANKRLTVNGLICPTGHSDELIKADFAECHYYDLDAIAKASQAPITIECQKCLESKGYKIEK
jgi:major membrane immunogen (membrane-anchored lipoprotein)